MANIRPEDLEPFDPEVDEEIPSLKDTIKKVTKGKKMQKTTPSPGSVDAGDMLVFNYTDLFDQYGMHLTLVVGNKRGKRGVFKGRAGYYVSAVKLNGLSDTISSLILENLYKNRKATYYNTVKAGLLAIVGKNYYRTYIVNAMEGTRSI